MAGELSDVRGIFVGANTARDTYVVQYKLELYASALAANR